MTGQHGTWIRQKERKILRLMAGAVLMLAAVWTLGGCGDGIPASAAYAEGQPPPPPLPFVKGGPVISRGGGADTWDRHGGKEGARCAAQENRPGGDGGSSAGDLLWAWR